jgi:hypothetical protein
VPRKSSVSGILVGDRLRLRALDTCRPLLRDTLAPPIFLELRDNVVGLENNGVGLAFIEAIPTMSRIR